MAQYNIIGITKEGSVFLIAVEGKDNPIKVDCRDMSITSYTGRTVKNFPASVTTERLDNTTRWAVDTIKDRIRGYGISDFQRLEMFIQYLDLITNPRNIPSECPQGYIKWVQDNGRDISRSSLNDFRAEKQIAQMPKTKREVYDKLIENWNSDCNLVEWWVQLTDEKLITKFAQMFKASLKEFTWNLSADLEEWHYTIIRNRLGQQVGGENWVDLLDGNRGFKHNLKNFISLRDKERNDKILATENRFRKITELSNDKFLIIVPSDMEEFTQEGKMQNNCVGSYYHDSMARGENFIYFIRKRSMPNRSYITNRFNVKYDHYTVETRMVNNNDNNDREARELIKISVLKNCMDEPKELATVLAERTHSEVVQVIGKKIVLYKESKNKKKIELPK